MKPKIAATIKIIKVKDDEVVYLQECPESEGCVGGSVKVGETIIIYEHEIIPSNI